MSLPFRIAFPLFCPCPPKKSQNKIRILIIHSNPIHGHVSWTNLEEATRSLIYGLPSPRKIQVTLISIIHFSLIYIVLMNET